jgi:hypothetical protein
MRNHPAVIVFALLALFAAFVIWLWASDAWLKFQCHQHDGRWRSADRVCAISAAPNPASPASPDR